MNDDPDSGNWNGDIMKGVKVKINDDKLLFRDSGVVFTLKGDILSMITEYNLSETDSPDAKKFNKFLDELHFDIHTKGKSSRDKNS